MREKVTVIGSLNYDIIVKISRLAELGETLPVDSATFASGGKGANQAVQAAKLGLPTYMIGCVGNDAQGDFLLKEVSQYGVKTDYIRRTDGPSGLAIVESLEDGSLYSYIIRGANFEVSKEDIDHAEPLLKESRLVILQMEIPQEVNEYAIQKAKACGCQVLMNAAPASEINEDVLKQCDILVVNEVEAGFYLKDNIDSVDIAKEKISTLAKQYECQVIMTLGKLGAVVYDEGDITYIPPQDVKAIETTGAGDSFIGGVAYALSLNQSLTEACYFATKCSAVTVCRIGAQPSMPTLADIEK